MEYTIPGSAWKTYYETLSNISKKAANLMLEYIQNHGYRVDKAFIDYAYALASRYGDAAGALSSQMYDYCAEYWKKAAAGEKSYRPVQFQPAEPAETATYGEVAKTMNGIAKTSVNPDNFANAVGRLVKRTAEDTTLKNAARDGAEFAWVPNGDTCSFCIMLASNGWQRMSKKAAEGNHAKHIHANCDCTYAVRFGEKGGVPGYDPDRYKEIYDNAEGNTWEEKLNYMRRENYAQNADKIREQKKAAYAERIRALKDEKQSGIIAEDKTGDVKRVTAVSTMTVLDKIESGEYSLKLTAQSYNKHVEGHPDYERYKRAREEKGLQPQGALTVSREEAQQIIKEKSATGIIRVTRNGTPTNIEDITCDKIVGYYWHNGKKIETNKAALHHGSKGSHLVPHSGVNYD